MNVLFQSPLGALLAKPWVDGSASDQNSDARGTHGVRQPHRAAPNAGGVECHQGLAWLRAEVEASPSSNLLVWHRVPLAFTFRLWVAPDPRRLCHSESTNESVC